MAVVVSSSCSCSCACTAAAVVCYYRVCRALLFLHARTQQWADPENKEGRWRRRQQMSRRGSYHCVYTAQGERDGVGSITTGEVILINTLTTALDHTSAVVVAVEGLIITCSVVNKPPRMIVCIEKGGGKWQKVEYLLIIRNKLAIGSSAPFSCFIISSSIGRLRRRKGDSYLTNSLSS